MPPAPARDLSPALLHRVPVLRVVRPEDPLPIPPPPRPWAPVVRGSILPDRLQADQDAGDSRLLVAIGAVAFALTLYAIALLIGIAE